MTAMTLDTSQKRVMRGDPWSSPSAGVPKWRSRDVREHGYRPPWPKYPPHGSHRPPKDDRTRRRARGRTSEDQMCDGEWHSRSGRSNCWTEKLGGRSRSTGPSHIPSKPTTTEESNQAQQDLPDDRMLEANPAQPGPNLPYRDKNGWPGTRRVLPTSNPFLCCHGADYAPPLLYQDVNTRFKLPWGNSTKHLCSFFGGGRDCENGGFCAYRHDRDSEARPYRRCPKTDRRIHGDSRAFAPVITLEDMMDRRLALY